MSIATVKPFANAPKFTVADAGRLPSALTKLGGLAMIFALRVGLFTSAGIDNIVFVAAVVCLVLFLALTLMDWHGKT